MASHGAVSPNLYREKLLILFLFFWLLSNWFVVTIGKRVFYHYFVFMIPPLCLLAVPAVLEWTDRLMKRAPVVRRPWLILLALGVFFPPLGYTVESVIGLSPQRSDLSKVVDYVMRETGPAERIFIWGTVPQIYFFSERDPATTFFWSDTLAGASPGTPSMEYMQATGRSLSLPESVLRDLQADFGKVPGVSEPVTGGGLHAIAENELLSIQEILELIENPFWKKVFEDFFRTPPVLILDTAPTGIRGFSNFPIEKYELLKKFIDDNYRYDRTVDGIIFYRLKMT